MGSCAALGWDTTPGQVFASQGSAELSRSVWNALSLLLNWGLSVVVKKELMAEAAASEKGLSMEEKVRGVLHSLLSTPRGCSPCPGWICQGIYKHNSPKPSPAHFGAWFYLLQEQEEEGAAAPSVSGVYFVCPLTGDIVRKDQKEKHLREAIQAVSASLPPLQTPFVPTLQLLPVKSPPGQFHFTCYIVFSPGNGEQMS